MNDSNEVNVGAADTFPAGEFRLVTIGRREIGVLRREDGQIHAVRNLCPHKGAPMCKFKPTGTMLPGAPGTLEWGRDGEILRCPWHGFEFELETGLRPYSDSKMRLRIYPARIEQGDVLIDVSPQRSPSPLSKETAA
ncbi:MAG: nitrite reductase (NADH) small subunit [Hyphomicrobiaceae bacterium]|jgi:nitrite reductase (NADH) small subunit